MQKLLIFISLICLMAFTPNSFKAEQKRYPRVRQAYADKEVSMKNILEKNALDVSKIRLYLRAFKKEKKIELWAKNSDQEQYKLIKEYEICRTSGSIGPKRKQGDRQIPEGFYHINIFNPHSNFYLSMGINYPNRSDRILGVKGKLGGDIFIHGSCVTIGCMPITDEEIKELYIFCVEAKNNGQKTIPITVFPTELSTKNFEKLKDKFEGDSDKIGLWTDLKKGYNIFNETKQLPSISFLADGRHNVR